MKNRGYTLLELLGVIIILALLTTLVFPSIINSIKKSSDKIDSATMELISNAADLYIDNNLNDFIKNNGNKYEIKLQDLLDSSNLPNSINLSNKDINDKCVQVIYENDKFSYTLKPEGTCETYIPICKRVEIVEIDEYTYGDKYVCNPGDGIERTFYLLEDGDNTELINGTTGTTGVGEISLIMDSNIGSSVAWAESGTNVGGPETALKYLNSQTKDWINVEVDMPTQEQITKIGLEEASWLTNNLSSNGYWLKSITSDNGSAYNIMETGITSALVTDSTNIGVRPVITINKFNIEKIELPKEYQEVEYIESTGTQYLVIDYVASGMTRSKGKFQITDNNVAAFLFCSRESATSKFYSFNWGGGKPYKYYNAYSTNKLLTIGADKQVHTFYKDKGNIYIDDNLLHSFEYVDFTTPGKMNVLACNNNGEMGYLPPHARLFNLKFYDNNTLMVDLVPCYRKSDNVIGMYDLVEDKFYTNLGTGTFLKGEDVKTQ